MLEVACRRCERRGRLRIERLIAEHGSGVLDLRAIIAADCPRMRNPSTSIYDRCGVHFPELLVLDKVNGRGPGRPIPTIRCERPAAPCRRVLNFKERARR